MGFDAGVHVASALFGPVVGGGLAHWCGDNGAIADDVLPARRAGVGHPSVWVETTEFAREPPREQAKRVKQLVGVLVE
ncbi:Uncharacterised protein [Mycobacteroides abscessus subsp. abscessus]|nr:Uncharacterised protein [Mycobacteroides abscessus subsp. abscessus]